MGAGWRRLVVAGGLQLAVLGLIGALGAVAVGGGAATLTAAWARTGGNPGATQSTAAKGRAAGRSAAQSRAAGQSAAKAAALARASAKAAALNAALSGLRTHEETLAERYDHEVALQQQAAAAYQAAQARLAVARKSQARAAAQLARLAAAEYESAGGPDMADAVLAGLSDPGGYLSTIGLQAAMDDQRTDLLAETQSDALVTRLFSVQAAGLLAQRRAAAQSAGFLKAALVAAVSRQAGLVRRADTARSRLAAEAASARASEAALAADGSGAVTAPTTGVTPPGPVPASVLAGGPSGAAPGVPAPDWAADAGASPAQGDVAAAWALTQLGKPYQWGAAGPGSYDCSGLALQAWARAGVRLLHWTGYQWVSGPHVPLARLRRGDLVFYAYNVADPATIHHVGIYLGHGLMVDAPYTGSFVRIDSIYAFPGLIGFVRPAA
jgi:cell wall-associated NlpC family hydrolase